MAVNVKSTKQLPITEEERKAHEERVKQFNIDLGNYLILLREAAGVSQSRIAQLSGTSAATISRVELGLRPLDMNILLAYSTLLSIPPQDLLDHKILSTEEGRKMQGATAIINLLSSLSPKTQNLMEAILCTMVMYDLYDVPAVQEILAESGLPRIMTLEYADRIARGDPNLVRTSIETVQRYSKNKKQQTTKKSD